MQSLIRDDVEGICYICGRQSDHVHHIFGGPCRKASDRRKLIVHLCVDCHMKVHKGGELMQMLHRLGQEVYESEIGSREQFREEFIRSYL